MFAAKGRPADHPVIVHLAAADQLNQFAADVPAAAKQLAAAFWPGPLTLVLRRGERISQLVTGGLDTVGLRVPGHPVAQALLREFGGPVAAPSANRFGRVSSTRAEHVLDELSGHVELVLDGGPCRVGLESTIVDVTGQRPAILRPGAVTKEQIEAVLAEPLGRAAGDAPRVSGSLPSHYAPRARVEIVTPAELSPRAAALAAQGKLVAVLSAEPFSADTDEIAVFPLPRDEEELAHELYATLRQVDELGCDVALVTLPKEEGLGVAIADRLRRAAGPRWSPCFAAHSTATRPVVSGAFLVTVRCWNVE
jgi:L-threonylcarbamoyladenylate synthase